MSTPFLFHFAGALIQALQERGLLELVDQEHAERNAVQFVADELDTRARGGSLISATSRALLRCPFVDELFADDDEIKALVQDLGPGR